MQILKSGDSDTHDEIVLRLLGVGRAGRPEFALVNRVTYRVPEAPAGLRRFTIPGEADEDGFVYDRATMPLIARALIDRDLLDSAALAHDYALRRKQSATVTRHDCDKLFRAVACRTRFIKRHQVQWSYAAVRLNSVWQDTRTRLGLRPRASMRDERLQHKTWNDDWTPPC